MATDCPTPKKARYRTKRDVWRDIRGEAGRPPMSGVRPYKCQCGKWHISSLNLVLLRVRNGVRSWTVATSVRGKVVLRIGGKNRKPISLELSARDTLRLMWALLVAIARSRRA